jgi:cbb3-type cytochrome oxidase maturation protein
MESLYLLIPVSVILVFVFAVAFWWSLRSGQYDDLEGPAYRVLMDDDAPGDERSTRSKPSNAQRAQASKDAKKSENGT